MSIENRGIGGFLPAKKRDIPFRNRMLIVWQALHLFPIQAHSGI